MSIRIQLREDYVDSDACQEFESGTLGVIDDIDTFTDQPACFYVTMEDGRETVLWAEDFKVIR